MAAELIVHPSIVLSSSDVLTADKLNLLGTPVVEMAVSDASISDQNFLRNGNFYSSFWTTPAGIKCPVGVRTTNASYWQVQPTTTIAGSIVTTGATTNGSPNVSAIPSTTGMAPGQSISGAGIPVGATISSVSSSTAIVLSANATVTATGAVLTVTVPGTGTIVTLGTTNATTTITGMPSTTGMSAGMSVLGAGIPVGTTIATVVSSTSITLSAAATASASGIPLTITAVAVMFLRSNAVPDTDSLFSAEIQGNTAVLNVRFSQDIQGDLGATLRNPCTFSGYLYNGTGLSIIPQLVLSSANAFNNFSATTDVSTTNLQSCSNGLWTYVTDTVDLTGLANIVNGFSVVVLIPGLDANTKYVLFSRLKFQIGDIATPFTDDVSLFVQTPTIDSTALQDGCIARPSLFLSNVVPLGAYVDKSITDPKIADNTIQARSLASGAISGSLGYTPESLAGGQICTGVHRHDGDAVVHGTTYNEVPISVQMTSANASNDGYMTGIGFHRPGLVARAIGLSTTNRFKTVDAGGTVGYLLDTVTGVDTNSYQDASVTYPKLAASLIAQVCPTGMIIMFGGGNIPTGWLVCDGTAVSRTTYAGLWAVLGTLWGAGDASSTFNLPDLRGCAPVGYVNQVGNLRAGITQRGFGVNAGYGEEKHQLTVAELAAHNHGVNQQTFNPQSYMHDPGHFHSYINPTGGLGAQPGSGQYSASGATSTGSSGTNISFDPITTSISIQNNGSNTSHNTMMPFAVCYFIIKYT